MANISSIKLPNGITYDIKDATARSQSGVTGVKGAAEGSYRTGNVNLTATNVNAYEIINYQRGTTDISVRPLISRARANRLAFLPASQVIIEKTTDGGTTWTDAGVTDAQKAAVFATSGSITIPLLNNAKSELCGVRVTITGMRYNVPSGTSETNKYNYWNSNYIASAERYFNVREWWFWVSANSDTIQCEIQAATGANSTTWKNMFNTQFHMTGWSGSDWIRAGSGATFGGGTNQTGNYWNWRLIFWSRKADNKDTFQSATAQSISIIQCYGDSVWTTPNSLMSNDHLYSYDVDKNATFPAKVTATTFVGALTGTASGNVTSVGLTNATNGGLTISGSPVTTSGSITVGHSNVLSAAQTTQAVYPIKIDKNGHISAYGTAVTIPTVTDTYSSTSSNAMSGKAVNAALQTLDSSISATTGQAISAITITDGKISGSSKININSVPSGGTTGQFLVKKSNTNYDMEWITVPSANGVSF